MRALPASLSFFLRYLLGVLLIVLLSLGVFRLIMTPKSGELGFMAVFFAVTAIVSSLAG